MYFHYSFPLNTGIATALCAQPATLKDALFDVDLRQCPLMPAISMRGHCYCLESQLKRTLHHPGSDRTGAGNLTEIR
jgi:hypothetical protein